MERVSGSMPADIYSIADYSLTVIGIPILYAEGCWARRQLYAGIRYIPTPSIVRKSPYSVERVSGSIPADIHLMVDYFSTVIGIPILFAGGCWARRQLHASIRSIPTPSIPMMLLAKLRGL